MGANNNNRYNEGEEIFKNLPNDLKERHEKLTTEGDMYYWNVNKKEDCLFNELTSNFDKIRVNYETYIELIKKIRSSNIPLFK